MFKNLRKRAIKQISTKQITQFAGITVALVLAGGFGTWLVMQQIALQGQIDSFQQGVDELKQADVRFLSTKDRITLQKEIASLENDRITTENTIRTTLVQGFGGFSVFITFAATVYFSSQNLRATQRNVEAVQRNVEIAQRNLKATEDKQVAERFSKAVELLAHESTHVRLGGIYALEKIAESEDSYYWQVMETLTAYVRERSPYPPKSITKQSSFVDSFIPNKSKENEIAPLPTDIQAVMTVLSRRKYSYRHGEDYRLDLRRTDLCRLELSPRAKLAWVNLEGSNLCRANLKEANLQNAFLFEANLQNAFLSRAKLQRARLDRVDLRNAFLFEAKLQQAHLNEANLRKAHLERASLQGTVLRQTEISILGDAIGLTWKQLQKTKSYEGALLPEYLLRNPPQLMVEETKSPEHSIESSQTPESKAEPPQSE